MKSITVIIIVIGLCILISSSLSKAKDIEWVKNDNLDYAITCVTPKSIIIILHGTNLDMDTSGIEIVKEHATTKYFIDSWLDKCAAVVIPKGIIMTVNDKVMESWDFTGEFTNHQNIDAIKDLVISLDTYDVPIVIVGGSAGALMAYRVTSELINDGVDVIDGLVLLDGMSPYSTTIYPKEGSYKNPLGISYIYGEDVLNIVDKIFDVPTYIAYSVDDPLMPTIYKQEFVSNLAIMANDLTIIKSGSGHEIGNVGVIKANDFVVNLID